ncbi:hypothetical protein HNQ94_002997 [Salirhabdus euzebyi]|uniref:Uncharacterized protein n=1 Tax=Salirhabdus euzebyi TaxID=394506 RepID=A0A841Q7X8_9BACI|nr:hypothetical protein [Salirhabdus euzebyi]MBB6454508.1 hypothetical protein [Salirhabdus euzebyi]
MNRFEKILLTVLFIELFVGGGGRLIDFGFLSIRQVLFLLLIATFLIRIIKERAILNKEINTFFRFTAVTIGVYLLMGWFIVSAIIGFINGHSTSIIIMDFLRVSYFAAYFPLAYYITKDRFSVERVICLLKYSALTVAVFTILIALLGKTFFAPNFDAFYRFMNTIMNDDLFFRPSNSVFYKSHLFVVLGLVISLNSVLGKKYTKVDLLNIVLCSISIIWSETRGFLLAFMISVIMIIILDTKVIIDPVKGITRKIKALLNSKVFIKKSIILLLVFISVPFLYKSMTLERFGVAEETLEEDEIVESDVDNPDSKENEDDKSSFEPDVNDISINARMSFILASKDILISNPSNLIIGTGYGAEIDGRVNGIEMSFLDILVEQGLVGLSIWFFLFLLVFLNILYVYKRGEKLGSLDISLLSAFMGLLLLTNINPFINNPIGIIFFLLLLVYSQNRKEQVKLKNKNGVL